jgi:hypothetical protein
MSARLLGGAPKANAGAAAKAAGGGGGGGGKAQAGKGGGGGGKVQAGPGAIKHNPDARIVLISYTKELKTDVIAHAVRTACSTAGLNKPFYFDWTGPQGRAYCSNLIHAGFVIGLSPISVGDSSVTLEIEGPRPGQEPLQTLPAKGKEAPLAKAR